MSSPQERIVPADLRNEMSRSYLEYAMSVIVGRALPDARDGLKPVHRRILYAMHELGLTADRPFRKCARVVGEVLGKYHPHGDTAVYDALVRMAQDFSMRHPLINGHGNFGSIDNDPPAAMRYTESRLQSLTGDALLQDIEAETVDFADNFDGSQQEPVVMPARIPQLLVNGSSGIAVGMATNIPPHNLGEIIDGLVALIDNPELTSQELMEFIPGPDFPTGAQIVGSQGIRDAYTTGRGSVVMRGVATIETQEHRGRPDRETIIITELPYQTNKASLIEKIADLVNDLKLGGISDIRDESDRDGMRVVIELKRDAYPKVVLNNLYKQTPLQNNFGVNMLAIVNGEPQLLNLRDALQVFLDFRVEVIARRTRYQLRKAQERDHLLQGYLIALDNLDAVIALIRGSADAASAKAELIDSYGFSSVQADAILQMQLRRLTALEAEKIQQEHDELTAKIADLEDILANRSRVLTIIKEEVLKIRAAHANERRTAIGHDENDLSDISLIANEQVAILVTEQGYIKRMLVDTFEAQNRATRGKSGTKMKDDDGIEHFVTCCTHDHIIFFTDKGISYSLRAYQIPESSRTAKGYPLVQMLPIPKEEKVTSVIGVSEFSDDEYLVMLTQGGYIKKTALSAFSRIRTNGLIAISLEEGDELRWVRRAREEDSVLIGSQRGMTIHFKTDHSQLRPLGRPTKGVRAMSLRDGDKIISMDILSSSVVEAIEKASEGEEDTTADMGPWVLVVAAGGLGKRVPVSNFRLQNRAGLGLVAIKFRNDDDELVALRIAEPDDELMIVSARGVIMRQSVNAISIQSRMATGVQLQRLDSDDAIAAVALVPHLDEDENALPSEEVAEAIADTIAEAEVIEELDESEVEVPTVVSESVEAAVAETEAIASAQENTGENDPADD